MNKEVEKKFSDTIEKIEFAEEFFSVSFGKRPISYRATGKKVAIAETETFKVYCIYDDDSFDIIVSIDEPDFRMDSISVRGLLV